MIMMKNIWNLNLNSDSKLPLSKMIKVLTIIIVVRAIFLESNKYYPHVFLGECLYIYYSY